MGSARQLAVEALENVGWGADEARQIVADMEAVGVVLAVPVDGKLERALAADAFEHFDEHENHYGKCVLLTRALPIIAAHVAERERAAVEAERHGWIQRLAALCDDDWLRKRDRCMQLPGANARHSKSAAGAWENAAHTIRQLLYEQGYDETGDRHAAYLAWMRDGRDAGTGGE